ncbi:F-box protein SKIP23 [Rhynchospora pubera]|uniref:F-box protein SKIP23 n=1 Tax=Rhynchospora pubera TaxID=906938 RepID=A0AAV8HRF5_9POAL|nr:F-box protein SKIP23 [Rhynchospora pubera]
MRLRGDPDSYWGDLPDELLVIIAQKAPRTNVQYVRLRSVCKAWRRALPPRPRHLLPPVPWLLLPRLPLHTCRKFRIPDSLFTFFDLSRSKTIQIRLPYVSGKHICGSSYGWLILEQHPAVSLLNPITQATILLPSLDAPPSIILTPTTSQTETETGRGERPEFSDQKSEYNNCILKASLSCNPTEPGCVVVAWFLSSSNWELAFCRIGDAHWTGLKMWSAQPKLLDFTFHSNSVYTLNSVNEVCVYDLQNLPTGNLHSNFRYGINICNKQVILVEGDADSGGPLVVENTNVVYKWFANHRRWLPVHDIGSRVLFLNPRHSINLQWDEGRENEIYYDIMHSGNGDGRFHVGINRLKLETGMILPRNPRPMGLFFTIPGLPLWITPSLT